MITAHTTTDLAFLVIEFLFGETCFISLLSGSDCLFSFNIYLATFFVVMGAFSPVQLLEEHFFIQKKITLVKLSFTHLLQKTY